MEYKEMAKVMTDEEVKTCMAILIEDSVILDMERNTIQNYIYFDDGIVTSIQE